MDVDAWIRWARGGEGVGLARGHEWSGEIVEVGSKVRNFKVGDRISRTPFLDLAIDATIVMKKITGVALIGLKVWHSGPYMGGFAEYVAIPFVTNESAAKMPGQPELG